jgi:hypothetical protein
MRRGTSLLTKFPPVSLSRDEEAGIVEHVTTQIEVFLFHKFINLQPVFQAAFLAGVE